MPSLARRAARVKLSDGSGTTFVFTQHLSAISDKWKSGPGAGTSIEWKGGVAGKKNDGVTALITQTPGAIGYIEYGFAISSKQPMASLENKAGKFVAPTLPSATAALKGVELPADLRAWVTDPVGDDVYPIVTYTWLLTKKKYEDAAKGAATTITTKKLECAPGQKEKVTAAINTYVQSAPPATAATTPPAAGPQAAPESTPGLSTFIPETPAPVAGGAN